MGGRGSNSKIQRRIPQPPPQAQPSLSALQPIAPAPDNDDTQAQAQAQQILKNPGNFSDTDTADFHDLYAGRTYFQQQQIDVDGRAALVDYLDPNELPGSLYNAAQEMNHAIVNGNMTPQQRYMRDSIVDNMHNLGYNLNLYRYDHAGALDDMLAQAGVKGGHQGLSISQIKAALVGRSFQDGRILSTSYNDFKNSSNPQTFTTREIKITYKAKASTQALMPGISSIGMNGARRGDDFGEILLAPTANGHNNYRIVDVKYSGAKARPKGGSTSYLPLQQIEIIVETD